MQPRFKYYSWVTRLAEMLTDDKKCHYAQALMTQYQVEKKPSNYDSSEHDEMVLERARQLQAEGYKVYVEEGQEQILAVITPDQPSLNWLAKSQQEALELDYQHLYELLTYIEERSDSQVFYTEYQVVDVLKTV